jgi:hypothetical protein
MLFINVHGETLLRHAEGRADIMRMLSMVEVDRRGSCSRSRRRPTRRTRAPSSGVSSRSAPRA